MDRNELLRNWQAAEQVVFTGWDFGHLRARMTMDELPWSYLGRAAELMRGARSVVDLDTGGGERFLELRPHWPPRVVATEEYPPNLRLATERLAPLGVQVIPVHLTNDDAMPFADGEFDLVLNRHAAFNPAEVARVLAAGGTFLTQQVHGMYAWDLQALFGAQPQWPDATPDKYVPRLQAAGLRIVDLQSAEGRLRFTDVAALVEYLKAVPWEVPDFSVARHADVLFDLQARLERDGELSFWSGHYLIEAVK
jgi:hypothetical protein